LSLDHADLRTRTVHFKPLACQEPPHGVVNIPLNNLPGLVGCPGVHLYFSISA
jgi:hypothetical protein